MTLQEFCLLPKREQIEILHQQAVYIGKRKRRLHTTILFQLDAFYVEVQYRQYRKVVQEIYCTASTTIVDSYLDQINVEGLVGVP